METEGHYAFQQIRDQEYDICFCLGISPQAAHAWAVPKEIIWDKRLQGSIQVLRKLRDTKWVRFNPNDPPAWIKEYGGTLEEAIESLLRYFEKQVSE
jgi:hypothetical protein